MSKDQIGKKRERDVMVIPRYPVNDDDVKRVLNIIIQGSLSQISIATLDLQIIDMDQFHLILSMEYVLINFLQRNTCFEAVLELVPMNHFGLAHESVGEGDDCHLNLDVDGSFFKMWAFV
ncbi:hypothetical protein AMTRI_Chr08g167730 [Amborella trichopoda]